MTGTDPGPRRAGRFRRWRGQLKPAYEGPRSHQSTPGCDRWRPQFLSATPHSGFPGPRGRRRRSCPRITAAARGSAQSSRYAARRRVRRLPRSGSSTARYRAPGKCSSRRRDVRIWAGSPTRDRGEVELDAGSTAVRVAGDGKVPVGRLPLHDLATGGRGRLRASTVTPCPCSGHPRSAGARSTAGSAATATGPSS